MEHVGTTGAVSRNSTFNVVAIVALVLLIVGGLNWGLVGLFNFDLVATLFGVMSPLSRIVYVLVGISAIVCAAAFRRMTRTV